MIPNSIFKAYDIRGIYPEELGESAAHQIGRAFAVYLKEDETGEPEKIIIGHDARISSPVLARAFIDGVRREGISVDDIGLVTVDAVYFASGKYQLPAAMVTASHNPKEWNGFKLMKKGVAILGGEEIQNIKAVIEINDWPKEQFTSGYEGSHMPEEGTLKALDIHVEYQAHILNFVDPAVIKPMRVAIDASSGTAGPTLKKILEKLPIEYTALNFEPDGDFPYHDPDPAKEKNLDMLKGELLMHHYHFGCAFDGDGDRIIFIDENGTTVSPSVIGAIMARDILKRCPYGKMVYAAVVSKIFPDVVDLYGGEAVREKVGHTFIAKRLKEIGGIFGVETSGHYYFKDNFYADSGIISFLAMLQILSRQNKSLAALAAEFSKYASMPEIILKIDNPREFIKKLAPKFGGYETDWLDGLTVRTDDFWLNLRPSNTEDIVRLNIEAKNEMILTRVKNDLLELIEKLN